MFWIKKYNQFYKVTPIGNAHLICVGNLEVEKTTALISFWKITNNLLKKLNWVENVIDVKRQIKRSHLKNAMGQN